MGIMTSSNGKWVPPTLKIKFPDDDPRYGGLWIRMRQITIGEVLERNELQAELVADEPRHPGEGAPIEALQEYAAAMRRYNASTLRRLAQDLADHTVAWNVSREVYGSDGEATVIDVKPDLEGYLAQPEGFLRAVTKAWREASVDVSAPLQQPSAGGTPSLTEVEQALSMLPVESRTPAPSS